MRVLAHLFFKPGADVQKFLAMRRDEAAKVWDFYKRDVLRDQALRADKRGAVFIFEVESVEAAEALVHELPAVQAGIFAYELTPLGPFESYETLFAAEAAS